MLNSGCYRITREINNKCSDILYTLTVKLKITKINDHNKQNGDTYNTKADFARNKVRGVGFVIRDLEVKNP
jgi:hypothetical protein